MGEATTSVEVSERPGRLTFYPFAYALYTEELVNYCWYCLAVAVNKRRCTGCGMALFCDKQCQTLGWKDHKGECKGLRTSTSLPDIETRLLGRIVIRYKAIYTGKWKEDSDFYKDRTSKRQILEIWAHTEKIREDKPAMAKFDELYKKLCDFYDPKFLMSKETVFELHCRDYINRHAISDKGYMKEIGKGLYLDLCAYDHSCAPNAIFTCNGFIATLRRLNDTVNLLDRKTTHYSYIEQLCSKQQRRKLLKDTWYFFCECERCVDNAEHVLTSLRCPHCKVHLLVKTVTFLQDKRLCIFGEFPYKDSKTSIITCPKCVTPLPQEYVMEGVSAMRFIDSIFENNELEQMPEKTQPSFLQDLLSRFSKILPPINVYYCRIIQALIPRILSSNYAELLRLHAEAEECVRYCFPHKHPAVAFHLRNMAIFEHHLGRLEDAEKHFLEAQDIMDYTLDPDHPMSVENRTLFEKVQKELAEKRIVDTMKSVALSDGETKKLNGNSHNGAAKKEGEQRPAIVQTGAKETEPQKSAPLPSDDDEFTDLPELID